MITWKRDRFGNPIPLPSLPVASIITSFVSLIYLAVHSQMPSKIASRLRQTFVNTAVQFSSVLFRYVLCKTSIYSYIYM